MLKLTLNEFRKMKFDEVLVNTANKNIASINIIENNGGSLLSEENDVKYYIIYNGKIGLK